MGHAAIWWALKRLEGLGVCARAAARFHFVLSMIPPIYGQAGLVLLELSPCERGCLAGWLVYPSYLSLLPPSLPFSLARGAKQAC